MAGYAGDDASLRRAGYSAVRSTAVQNLLELAAINAPGDAKISDREIDAKIAKLIRSADSNVSIKAMELHAKRETAREDAGKEEEEPFEDFVKNEARQILGSVFGGLLSVASMHLGIIKQLGPRVNFVTLPLFAELAPNIKDEYPEIWLRILNGLDAECRAEAERFARRRRPTSLP
jgi:hypothetical protein